MTIQDNEPEMWIGKKVLQPFLITSQEVLRLLRTGKAEINLPKEIGFQLIINDDRDDGDEE